MNEKLTLVDGKIKSRMTMKDSKECNKYIQQIVKEIDRNMIFTCDKVVSLTKKYVSDKKEKKLEMLLFIHRELLKHLLLYPTKHILIGDKNKKKELNGKTSFIYNIALAKDIIDTEMVESGASEKIAEAIYKASNEIKPKKEDISYIG